MEDPVHSTAGGARRRLAHCVAACATVAIGWMAAAMPASADPKDHDDRGSRKKPTLLATPPLYWNNLQTFVCSVTNVGTEPQEVTVTQHTEFRFIGGGGPLPDIVTTITLPPGPIQSFPFGVPRVVPFPTGNWCIFESADTSVLRSSAAIRESGRVLSTIVASGDQNGRKHGGAGKRAPTVLATPPFFLEATNWWSSPKAYISRGHSSEESFSKKDSNSSECSIKNAPLV